MTEIEELNKEYLDCVEGDFPFMSKYRITILKSGYYTKQKANYRGLTYMFDANMQRYKTLLIGFFHVPEDYIVVPEEVEITEGKQALIDIHKKKGYKVINKFPSLTPKEFDENSREYELAYQTYIKFKGK